MNHFLLVSLNEGLTQVYQANVFIVVQAQIWSLQTFRWKEIVQGTLLDEEFYI